MSNDIPPPKPRFTGLFIPAEILEIEELTNTDYMLLAWIDALYCQEKGGCFASNQYLAMKLKIKENTVKILISKLVDLGLVERISFDGRQRILRACKEKWFNRKHQSTSEVDLNQPLQLNKINPCGLLESTPLLYRDKSLYKSLDNPPPIPQNSDAAKAAQSAIAEQEEDYSSKKSSEFSEDVKNLTHEIVKTLKEHNEDYRPPANLSTLYKDVKLLLINDKYPKDRIMQVLKWALSDTEERDGFKGWCSVIYCKKPIQKLREYFTKLCAQMKSKPKRKFAPCSDDNKALQALQEMEDRAI